jgi:hypothetical protein
VGYFDFYTYYLVDRSLASSSKNNCGGNFTNLDFGNTRDYCNSNFIKLNYYFYDCGIGNLYNKWQLNPCYNGSINTNLSITDLISSLVKKGGRVDKYYLREWNKNKTTLVYLNGWFKGKNIREALLKALTP